MFILQLVTIVNKLHSGSKYGEKIWQVSDVEKKVYLTEKNNNGGRLSVVVGTAGVLKKIKNYKLVE